MNTPVNIRNLLQIHPVDSPKFSLAQRLVQFLDLPQNWNGYGGQPPTEQAIEECWEFICSLQDIGQTPKLMLAGSGEVGLFWDREDQTGLFYIEIGFKGTGKIGYLIEQKSEYSQDITVLEKENQPSGKQIPHELGWAITQFNRLSNLD